MFDRRYWDITVEYAKAAPATLHAHDGPQRRARAGDADVLPTLWFRNTWSWDDGRPPRSRQSMAGRLGPTTPELGTMVLAGDGTPQPLFCDNETNAHRLLSADGPAYPKDGINDHVVAGAATVNPERTGPRPRCITS